MALRPDPCDAFRVIDGLPGDAQAAHESGGAWLLAHLWFHVESPTASGATLQGDTQTYRSGQFGSAKASTFTGNTSNGGYGSYSNSVANSAGLAYIDSTITGASSIGAILLIAQDTTPGREFFCWALKTTGGNDELHRDCCHALDKSPGTTGWCSLAIFPRTSRQPYETVALHGLFGQPFWQPSPRPQRQPPQQRPPTAQLHRHRPLRPGARSPGTARLPATADPAASTFVHRLDHHPRRRHPFRQGDPPRWGDAAAGPALPRPRHLAVAAQRHQPQPGQPPMSVDTTSRR